MTADEQLTSVLELSDAIDPEFAACSHLRPDSVVHEGYVSTVVRVAFGAQCIWAPSIGELVDYDRTVLAEAVAEIGRER